MKLINDLDFQDQIKRLIRSELRSDSNSLDRNRIRGGTNHKQPPKPKAEIEIKDKDLFLNDLRMIEKNISAYSLTAEKSLESLTSLSVSLLNSLT